MTSLVVGLYCIGLIVLAVMIIGTASVLLGGHK